MERIRAAFWAPFWIVTLGCSWAIFYVLTTIQQTKSEPEAVLLIEPLLYPLVITGGVIFWSLRKFWNTTQLDLEESDDAEGLSDPRRIYFVLSLPLYGIGIHTLGFLIPTFIVVIALCYALGVRNIPRMFIIAIGVLAFIWVGFVWLLSVPLPLWP